LSKTFEEIFVASNTKRDDLSDCFLQGLIFVESMASGSLVLTESKPVEKKAKPAKAKLAKASGPKAKRQRILDLTGMDDS
jgi:hypothetical protein